MAQNDIENPIGFVDIRECNSKAGGNTRQLGTVANYASVGALRTRLAAANGTYFTASRLDQMTKNDMEYALRLIDDAASVR